MAIKLEFCNIIVPISKIEEKLGKNAFANRFKGITDFSWHDEHLFREGCMNQWDLEELLDEWKGMGFELLNIIDGKKHWKDLCIVNSGYGPSYPCAWLEYNPKKNIVWLKGHEPGVAVGPAGRKVASEE
ncbi:hypothetical protein ACFL35_05780 [Candidatus Riflebacteria bacterium]